MALFRQMYDRTTCTFTYLLADKDSKAAILIDSVDTHVTRDLKVITELGLTLTHVLNTHVHADHVTGSGSIKTTNPSVKSVLGLGAKDGQFAAKADLYLADGDTLAFGAHTLKALATPGHTAGCTTYVVGDRVFCGDTLFVRGCGRTDFQGGCSTSLYNSVHKQIFSLPDDYSIYPGHDYNGKTQSSVGEEKQFNPRLTKSEPEFVALMAGLNLSVPNLIDVAVPANMACGYLTAPEATPALAAAHVTKGGALLVDLRSEGEVATTPLLAGAVSLPCKKDNAASNVKAAIEAGGFFPADKSKPVVLICASGARAALAIPSLAAAGYSRAINGGDIAGFAELVAPKA